MQTHVITAVFRRQFAAYFATPAGYVFITIFVFLAGLAAFWTPAFFQRNLANLDQLNAWFPMLLVFIVPAIAMSAWADERRQGADELLLTLPARDSELVLGKYLACAAIYTVALAFSVIGQLGVLYYLGTPDAGLLFSTYLGQWLAGVSLLALAMAAASLTANMTVAFILAAVLCALVVGAALPARLNPDSPLSSILSAIALPPRFVDFGRGVITPDNVFYFLALSTIGLWANVFIISRTHWAGAPGAPKRSSLASVRFIAYLVAAGALTTILARTPIRADATAERLWTLAPETRSLLRDIPQDRTVLVTAYVSPATDTPASYTQTRENLLGVLREFDRSASGRIALKVVETSPFSDEARDASKNFKIEPRTIPPSPDDPDQSMKQVYLGVAVASGPDQTVIPFLAKGLSPEYELARAVRTVSARDRKNIGILETEAALFARFNFQTFTPGRDWPIVAELRKQYEVTKVARRAPIPNDIDAFIVAQPSTLTDGELTHVLDWIKQGKPTLILEDPLPLANPAIATSEPREATRNPMQQQQQPQDPKANLAPLWKLLGVQTNAKRVIWDGYNPRPSLADLPPEFVFVAAERSGRFRAGAKQDTPAISGFNDRDPISSGLQELVMMAPGAVTQGPTEPNIPAPTFTPLLLTSSASGFVNYDEVLQRTFFGPAGFNPNRRFNQTPEMSVLAARITRAGAPPKDSAAAADEPPTEGPSPAEAASAAPPPLNVICIADLDMISEVFFSLREEGAADFEFDNVTFILNAVDTLAGDESLLNLRKRRAAHRTLDRIEARRLAQQEATQQAIDNANAEAEKELSLARDRMNAKVKEIEAQKDLDDTTRRIMIESVRQTEQRRLDVQSAAIEDDKQQRIADARADARQEISRIEMNIRLAAVALPPIPALLLAGIVFVRRRALESEGVSRERLR